MLNTSEILNSRSHQQFLILRLLRSKLILKPATRVMRRQPDEPFHSGLPRSPQGAGPDADAAVQLNPTNTERLIGLMLRINGCGWYT